MQNKQSQKVMDEIERVTLNHYESNSESFWQGTRDHDVSQNITALLDALPKDHVLDLLDFGCGPGRDLLALKSLGHRAIGLDGNKTFCEMAEKHSGCSVLHQQFLSLDIGTDCFDGIFANASMFHVPSQELPRVLVACNKALREGGVLFTSNPRGNAEGWQGQRYGNYMEFEENKACLEQAGFALENHYYRPEGRPRDQQPWLAMVAKKIR